MGNQKLRAVIFENIEKMLLMGLQGTPFVRSDEQRDVILEVWLEALTDSKFTDAHALMVAKCWRAMRRQAVRWFTPAQLIESIRAMPQRNENALPNLSQKQIAENKQRLAELLGTLEIG